jgi:hypothetical protein
VSASIDAAIAHDSKSTLCALKAFIDGIL